MGERIREGWHLDKKVPLGLIMALFMQTTIFVWYLAGLDGRVVANETRIESVEEDVLVNTDAINVIRAEVNRTNVTLGRFDEKLENIQTILTRIEDRYERDNP